MWGIGRHVLGSQVYDYWADPWGRVHEHWADSDRLNLANGSNLIAAEEALRSQWGERPPEKFIGHVQRVILFPPPLSGRGRGGGREVGCERRRSRIAFRPPPSLPQGGGS